MARISLIDEKLDKQNNGSLMSSLENCFISTYLLWFSTRVQMEKNWVDTPSATLIVWQVVTSVQRFYHNNMYCKFKVQTILVNVHAK